MTAAEFRQHALDITDEYIGLLEGVRDRLKAGEDVVACLRSVEGVGNNADLDAMMLARKAPKPDAPGG